MLMIAGGIVLAFVGLTVLGAVIGFIWLGAEIIPMAFRSRSRAKRG